MKLFVQDRQGQLRRISWLPAVFLLVSWTSPWAQCQDAAGVQVVAPAVEQAIERGTQFLLNAQKPTGAIVDDNHATTMSSLAIMALASVGHQPGDPTKEGEAMSRALDFVLNGEQQDDRGYFGRKDRSRMYGHGITTLMLTEMLGMGGTEEQDEKIHAALKNAIQLTLAAQAIPKPRQFRGGWRYEPDSRDSDLSVSVWQLMALRSAKNDGLEVPSTAIDQAVSYLRESYAPDRSDATRGGFTYVPRSYSPSFAMTSAGLLAMQVCGQYDASEVEASTNWLRSKSLNPQERFFYYGCYYFAQGMHQRGGEPAEQSRQDVRTTLLSLQNANGAWRSNDRQETDAGEIYTTSLAILSLSVQHHFLPIYQR